MFALFFQRVLTAEYIDGCKISNLDAIKSMNLSLKDVSSHDVTCCISNCLHYNSALLFYDIIDI